LTPSSGITGFAFKRRGYGLRIQAAGLRASRKKIRRRTTDFFDFAKAKASAFGIGVSFAT